MNPVVLLLALSPLCTTPGESQEDQVGRLGLPGPRVSAPRLVDPAGWPWSFTAAQRRRLGAAGWQGDLRDRWNAHRLYGRGFGIAEYISAYELVHRRAPSRRAFVQSAAVWQALSLPAHRFGDFVSSGSALTRYVNRHFIYGLSMEVGGWTVATLGLATLVAGGLMLIGTGRGGGDGTGTSSGAWFVVGAVIGAGGLVSAVGVPIGAVGTHRRRTRWWNPGTLESASRTELRSLRLYHHLRTQRRARCTTWRLQPRFSRGGGGLAFQLRF